MIISLLIQSAGAGVGAFIGVLIGVTARKRKGNTEGLLARSPLLTAAAAGLAALLTMMLIKYFTGASL
ncbi:MAG: hypothetical protein AAF214_09375 [Pseudomonadota bacterium]